MLARILPGLSWILGRILRLRLIRIIGRWVGLLRTSAYLAVARPPHRHVESLVHGLACGGIDLRTGPRLWLRLSL